MGRPEKAVTDAQLPLAVCVQAVHADGGKRIRALLRRAIAENGMSQSDLAAELGKDESQHSRMLADDKGANPGPDVYAAVMAKDRKRILIGGLAAMCGCAAVEQRPDPEQELRKLRDQLRGMQDALARALGEGA